MSKFVKQNYRGFTLLEMVVALFVFSLMMMAVTQTFTSAYSGYRMNQRVNHDLENTQYALNAIAKALRTSSIVSASGAQQLVQFYDYSQKKCFRYRISGGQLEEAFATLDDVVACKNQSFGDGAFSSMVTGTVTGSFLVTPSTKLGGPATLVGRVTISLTIYENDTHKAHMQTTVSLRDFGAIGL